VWPGDGQLLNRNSYVRNNPLNATDPSGYFLNKAFKGLFRAIGNIPVIGDAMRFVATNQYLSSLVSIGVGILTGGGGALAWGAMAWAAGTQVALVGMAGGGLGDALTAGAIAAASVAAFGAIHELKAGEGIFKGVGSGVQDFAKSVHGSALLHGTVGGTMSVASGGKFHAGFLSGGFGNLAGAGLEGLASQGGVFEDPAGSKAFRVVYQGAAGGAGSVMGGGKFGNGAVTAAFGYLFNEIAHAGISFNLTLFGRKIFDFSGGLFFEMPHYNVLTGNAIEGTQWSFGTYEAYADRGGMDQSTKRWSQEAGIELGFFGQTKDEWSGNSAENTLKLGRRELSYSFDKNGNIAPGAKYTYGTSGFGASHGRTISSTQTFWSQQPSRHHSNTVNDFGSGYIAFP